MSGTVAGPHSGDAWGSRCRARAGRGNPVPRAGDCDCWRGPGPGADHTQDSPLLRGKQRKGQAAVLQAPEAHVANSRGSASGRALGPVSRRGTLGSRAQVPACSAGSCAPFRGLCRRGRAGVQTPARPRRRLPRVSGLLLRAPALAGSLRQLRRLSSVGIPRAFSSLARVLWDRGDRRHDKRPSPGVSSVWTLAHCLPKKAGEALGFPRDPLSQGCCQVSSPPPPRLEEPLGRGRREGFNGCRTN